jgi:hypothetical protein
MNRNAQMQDPKETMAVESWHDTTGEFEAFHNADETTAPHDFGHYVWVMSEDRWLDLQKNYPKAIAQPAFFTTAVVVKMNDGRLLLDRYRHGASGQEITKDQLHNLIHTGKLD